VGIDLDADGLRAATADRACGFAGKGFFSLEGARYIYHFKKRRLTLQF